MIDDDFNIDPQDQFYTLMACVEQCCIDLDLAVQHYGNKMLSWGARALVDLKLDASSDIKAIILNVDDVLSASVPMDFVDWVFVAEVSNQYFKPLCYNDRLLAIPRTTDNFNPTTDGQPGSLPNGTDMYSYGGWAFSRRGGRALFAYGGGLPQAGHFRIVNCEGGGKQILLDVGVCSTGQLYLEYISTGFSACKETVLHPYFFSYVRQYIHWQYAQFKKDGKSEAEIQRLGREVYHQECLVKGRLNCITPVDLLKISRKNYRLTNHA